MKTPNTTKVPKNAAAGALKATPARRNQSPKGAADSAGRIPSAALTVIQPLRLVALRSSALPARFLWCVGGGLCPPEKLLNELIRRRAVVRIRGVS